MHWISHRSTPNDKKSTNMHITLSNKTVKLSEKYKKKLTKHGPTRFQASNLWTRCPQEPLRTKILLITAAAAVSPVQNITVRNEKKLSRYKEATTKLLLSKAQIYAMAYSIQKPVALPTRTVCLTSFIPKSWTWKRLPWCGIVLPQHTKIKIDTWSRTNSDVPEVSQPVEKLLSICLLLTQWTWNGSVTWNAKETDASTLPQWTSIFFAPIVLHEGIANCFCLGRGSV